MSSKQKEDEAKKDPREAVNLSCRGPVLFLAFSAIAWLLVYSLFAMLAGVKVHAAGMMADSAWLSYGRILPAADLALQFDVMAGAAPGQPMVRDAPPCGTPEPRAEGRRVAWLGDWGGAWPMEEGILALCESALGVLDAAGARVDAVGAPFDRDALWQSWVALRAWSNAADLGPLLDDPATAGLLKPEALWEIEQGRALSALDVHRASLRRSDWYRQAMALFETHDVLALPTAQAWPFPADIDWPREVAGVAMDTYHRWMEVVIPASLLGLPVVAVPAGFGAAGLPMGLQLIGAPGTDAMLLEVAEAYHRATNWPEARPPLLS